MLSARLLVTVLACALLASACGRRGPLEPPPGAEDKRRAATAENSSTFGGSPTFRPARETETSQNADLGVPSTPSMQPSLPGTTVAPVGPQTISAGAAGLRSTSRNLRRSPPPTTPFILDPLL